MPRAGNQPQLLRSCQKDEFYINFLRLQTRESGQSLAGMKRWLEWRKEIELLADLTYFTLTTLAGYQTLGEEYVNIVQVAPSGRAIPSRLRRAALIALHTCLPYLLERGLHRLEGGLQREARSAESGTGAPWNLGDLLHRAVGGLSEQQRKVIELSISLLRQAVTILHRLHLGIFYLNGMYYHMAKRITGITYLCVRSQRADNSGVRASYRLLGWLSLLQLVLSVAVQVNGHRQRRRARQEWQLHRNLPSSSNSAHDLATSRHSRCILCLEKRRHSTATPCGHLFCWECITEWCNTKAECPLCREKFEPHRLIYLRHFG
ncbi:peroxisome biogenesis factor 10 isoform X1 [Callorhinchus milii]|uniref:peroxisome biogenesis factor 10 isoform X1 n=2 Tax=Callorhinchus milii TaxID=7868 RepID=UPI001C3FCA6C|nr:peroxisome biogenesis factor 10 isoform X1 [Callorhinchus milii]